MKARIKETGDVIEEIWLPVVGSEATKEVSNYGRVRSLDQKVFNGKVFYIKKGRILKLTLSNKGYLTCCINGKNQFVHRVVAKTFIPNISNYPCINHKNEIKTDNRVDNLEWCTYRYNNEYGTHREKSISTLKKCGERKRICVYSIDNYGNIVKKYSSIRDASLDTNLSSGHISECCNGKRITVGGLKWRRAVACADALISELKKTKEEELK